ncbi:MAG: DUF975 family protein [Eubacterium sp.]|nr:DUF975 family protein [Eubacterium sp.]
MNRAYLKERGKAAFKNNYWFCVLVALITGVATGSSGGGAGSSSSSNLQQSMQNMDISREQAMGILIGIMVTALLISLVAFAVKIFALNPLLVGCRRFWAVNSITKAGMGELGWGFKNGHYKNVMKTMFMKDLFIFLWSLLFIIPGIIKTYEYYMVDYILTENPDMDWHDALEQSKQMMYGNKFDTFILELSFFGWALLGVLTCGILLIFYVNPYMLATFAELYHSLRGPGYNPGGNYVVNGPSGFANDPRYGYNPDQQAQPAQQPGYYDPSTGERVVMTPQQPQDQGYYDPSQGQGYYDPNQGQGYYDPNQGQGYDPNNPYV